jgi:hypothetical protein
MTDRTKVGMLHSVALVLHAPMIHALSAVAECFRDGPLSYSTLLLYNDTVRPQFEEGLFSQGPHEHLYLRIIDVSFCDEGRHRS